MGCIHNCAIFFVILVISTTSHLRLFNAQGREVAQSSNSLSQSESESVRGLLMKEEKRRWRVQIGSRPPRCDRRCDSCGPCEAIQVPTNPHPKNSVEINGRDYGNSNYKPMSWKCKCGNLFFNP